LIEKLGRRDLTQRGDHDHISRLRN